MGGINKSLVYRYLKKCQENTGGYTGTDIVKLAHQLNVNRTTLSRNIEKWSEVDMRFSDIIVNFSTFDTQIHFTSFNAFTVFDSSCFRFVHAFAS